MPNTPTGLSDEKAARMMAALRSGSTLRKFAVKAPRLEAYFKAHPEYARVALPLIEANAEAARFRKGDRLRTTTHCRAGLHLMIGDNVVPDGSHGRKRCLACRRIGKSRPTEMRPEVVAAVKQALQSGATIGQIIHGRPVGGGKTNHSLRVVDAPILSRYRRENPEFNRFVLELTKGNYRRGQRLRWQRTRNAAIREESNDYFKIRAMLPTNLPIDICDDVVQSVFLALVQGSLQREEVKRRLPEFIAAYNRQAKEGTGKYGHFSLDAPIFADGATTRGDMITRGLWD